MLVSQGPWWWIRVLPPGAVVTMDEYSPVEPATSAETAIARSMAAFWPVPTTNSDGRIRFAIRPMIAAGPYDPGVSTPRSRESPVTPAIPGTPATPATPSVPAIAGLPRVALLDGPTPLQPLPRLSEAVGGHAELWVKREDLGPIPFSGNKVRNLELLLGAALQRGADAIVTSGRRWSNHCRLTAAAGGRLGLDVHLVVSGPPVRRSPNLELIRLFGGTVHQAETDAREEREALVEAVAADLGASGRTVEVIAIGGSGVTGALGQVHAWLEATQQAAALGFRPDVVVLPSASGGTQAGLIVGAGVAGGPMAAAGGTAAAGAPTRVIGVLAARPAAELQPVIEGLITELAAFVGIDAPLDAIELDPSELGRGYGVPTPESEAASRLLARTEGILVDPVYTAKGLAGVIRLVRSGELDGRRVVFWHGGGLPAIFEDLPTRR
jgi:1-aminocyclopropane-1-carboxylate deaminase/D-cysteine desulfhydrase-like pyridoxal-dependent ACC family enzyme